MTEQFQKIPDNEATAHTGVMSFSKNCRGRKKEIMNLFHFSFDETILETYFSYEDMQRIGVDETELGVWQ